MSKQNPFFMEALPNAAKLTSSLRHTGYDNTSAIADLIDNCIDAGAQNVYLQFAVRDKKPEIYIIDDGCGMNQETLSEAVKLGSMVTKDNETELGFFGMGLCTASWSIGRRLEIYTTPENDSNIYHAIIDIDHFNDVNKFEIEFYKHDMNEKENKDLDLLRNILIESGGSYGGSGTLLILRKIDSLDNQDIYDLKNKIAKKLSEIFRTFLEKDNFNIIIKSGITILADDRALEPFDPLYWNHEKTEQYDNSTIIVKIKDDNDKIHEIDMDIKLSIIPKGKMKGKTCNEQDNLNIKTQGFYIMRNNRQIDSSNNLDLYKKHNILNQFRGEISFSGKWDDVLNITFKKEGIKLNQSIFDQLEKYLSPQITSIRKRLQKEQSAVKKDDVSKNLEETKKRVKKRSNLLTNPKAKQEKRKSPVQKGSGGGKDNNKTRNAGKSNQNGNSAGVDFDYAHYGLSGPIYEAEQRGRTIYITLNVDHPLYSQSLESSNNIDMSTIAGCLIYALASAELVFCQDDEEKIVQINVIKSIMSSNLASLLR